jgi:DNA processing protein
MFSPETQNPSPALLEYLWRTLRLPRRAIRFLLHLYSAQEIEAMLRRAPREILAELPERWKKDVPGDPPRYGEGQAPDIFFTPIDPDYPPALHDLNDPPWVLYGRGNKSLLQHPGPRVAVVGTRRASDYAKRVTAQVVAGCKPYRPLIISGMAWGIDGVAHRSALQQGMATVGVLGAPFDQGVSPARQKLMTDMKKFGLLLTEIYPEATMGPWRFPERNRLLAAWAQAIVVVEAPLRSGALLTAQEGLELGREIFVVPGPLSPHFNAGGHRLIQDGAQLLTHPDEIFQVLGYDPACADNQADAQVDAQDEKDSEASKTEAPVDPTVAAIAAQIVQMLRGGPLHVDKIIAISQKPAPTVLACLIEMSLAGSLLESGAGYFEII